MGIVAKIILYLVCNDSQYAWVHTIGPLPDSSLLVVVVGFVVVVVVGVVVVTKSVKV